MERRLRRKFILVAMAAVSIVLAAIMGTINVISYLNLLKMADARLDLIEAHGGALPESETAGEQTSASGDGAGGADRRGQFEMGQPAPRTDQELSAETPFETRFFTVTLDATGAAIQANTSKIAAVSQNEAVEAAQDLAASNGKTGFWENYRYRAVSLRDSGDEQGDGTTMYLFLDCTRELDSFRSFLIASIGTSALGWVLVLALVIGLSRAAIKPIAESYHKQRRFITDASHEIKTPLSIIDADNEVIELESGESEWTRGIHEQVERLSKLTERLVFLARMDEGAEFTMSDIDLAKTVEQAVEPYRTVARTHDLRLSCDIEAGLRCRGDKAALSQAIELLLDNAMRYARAGSVVEVGLHARGRGRVITVRNACDQLPSDDLDRLFDRFYRADSSRSRSTGGTGVGLSVVRAIAQAHKGAARCRILADNTIEFAIEL